MDVWILVAVISRNIIYPRQEFYLKFSNNFDIEAKVESLFPPFAIDIDKEKNLNVSWQLL